MKPGYEKRFNDFVAAIKGGGTNAVYDTTIPIGSNLQNVPLPRAANSALNDVVLQTLIEYASANNSDAFLVYEAGRITQESYFGDINDNSLINSKSLAKQVGTIAIGRAINAGAIKSLDQSASDFLIECATGQKYRDLQA